LTWAWPLRRLRLRRVGPPGAAGRRAAHRAQEARASTGLHGTAEAGCWTHTASFASSRRIRFCSAL
jgi:hypothetical protein